MAHRWENHSNRANPYAYIRYMPDMRLQRGYTEGTIFRGQAPGRTPFEARANIGGPDFNRPADIGKSGPGIPNVLTPERTQAIGNWMEQRRSQKQASPTDAPLGGQRSPANPLGLNPGQSSFGALMSGPDRPGALGAGPAGPPALPVGIGRPKALPPGDTGASIALNSGTQPLGMLNAGSQQQSYSNRRTPPGYDKSKAGGNPMAINVALQSLRSANQTLKPFYSGGTYGGR